MNQSTGLADRRAFLETLVRDAGALALRMRQDLGPLTAKHPLDFCTEADHAVEQLIRDRITSRFGDSMIGEEAGGIPSARVWVVDPIDGTMNYIYGSPRWCVSIGYVESGVLELGAIYTPREDVLFLAQRGAGAFANGERLRLGPPHGAAPVVEAGWSTRRPLEDYLGLLGRLMSNGFQFRRHGSAALGMADVARGVNDAYVELNINAWDVMAGVLLVQEAGGWTNDFLANDGLTRGNPIVACRPELQERLAPLVL